MSKCPSADAVAASHNSDRSRGETCDVKEITETANCECIPQQAKSKSHSVTGHGRERQHMFIAQHEQAGLLKKQLP